MDYLVSEEDNSISKNFHFHICSVPFEFIIILELQICVCWMLMEYTSLTHLLPGRGRREKERFNQIKEGKAKA